MDNQLLVDLHQDAQRQGPGGEEQTRLAITVSGLKKSRELKIADIGCGSGAATFVLAKTLGAHITAVDICPEFLNKLAEATSRIGVADHVVTRTESMEQPSFAEEELDAIWSEDAIYNMGFAEGIEAWRKYLKSGGILAVSELTWLTEERPEELQAYWDREYPKVDTASATVIILPGKGRPMGLRSQAKPPPPARLVRPQDNDRNSGMVDTGFEPVTSSV